MNIIPILSVAAIVFMTEPQTLQVGSTVVLQILAMALLLSH